MKVAVLANLKEDAPVAPEEPPGRWDDLDDLRTVQAILESLRAYGNEATYFPAGPNLVQDLKLYQPDICFNMGEMHFGASREAQVPALLDMLKIPYTGSGVTGMTLSHNKHIAKRMFRNAGLPTADFFVVTDPDKIPYHSIHYPLFVKPAHEGSSIGVNDDAIVYDRKSLERQVRWAWNVVKSPILVERYISGRELTLGVMGDEVLPIVEIVSPTGYYSNALKEQDELAGVYRVCPAQLPQGMTERLQRMVQRAMDVLDLSDLCRMDLRMDAEGNPYILEVNPLPLLYPDPEQASFIYASRQAGYSYAAMINKIFCSALNRLGLKIEMPAVRDLVPVIKIR